MTLVFFVVLALAWAAVFVPAAVRARQSTPYSSAERFKRGMDRIAPTLGSTGRWVVMPAVPGGPRARTSYRRMQMRRVRLLQALLVLSATSFVLALPIGGTMWQVHLVCVASLALYVTVLVGAKRRRLETRAKIRPLQPTRPSDQEVIFHEPVHASGGSR